MAGPAYGTLPLGEPGFHQAEPIIRTHRIGFRRTLVNTDVREDMWDIDTQFPLFGSAGTLIVTSSDSVSDDGKTVRVQGLDANGDFQDAPSVVIGDPASALVWRRPLAQIRLNGASGIRTGTSGDVTAAVGGTAAARILTGDTVSHSSCREIPDGERWVVTAVTASPITDAAEGNVVADVTLSLVAAHPDTLVEAQREWRLGEAFGGVAATEFYDAGSYFFVTGQTDTTLVLIAGTVFVEVFKLPGS